MILIAGLAFTTGARPQTTARGLGMGGAFTALARGVHAPHYNPANLGLPDNSRFSFTLLSLGTSVWNNSFSLGMYNQYNGASLDSADVVDILNAIPDDGFTLDANVLFNGFSSSIGRFAFTFQTHVYTYIRLDKDLFTIPLQGNEMGETYTLDDMKGEAFSYASAGLSYAQPLPIPGLDAFSIGASLRVLLSAAYAKVGDTHFSLTTAPYGFDIEGEYEALYSYPKENFDIGKMIGFSGDMGLAMRFADRWTVSASLFNLISAFPKGMTGEKQMGTIFGDSLGVMEDLSESIEDSSWTVDNVEFTIQAPKILRAGIAYEEGPVLLAIDYCQGFTESYMSSTKPQVSIGTEYRGLPWLPLRMGVVIGGRVGLGTAIGLGIRPGGFVLDIAIMNQGFVLPSNSKGLAVAFELGIDLKPAKQRSDVVRVKGL